MDQDDDLERKIAGLTESVAADIWLAWLSRASTPPS
jgi:hypothetical protein